MHAEEPPMPIIMMQDAVHHGAPAWPNEILEPPIAVVFAFVKAGTARFPGLAQNVGPALVPKGKRERHMCIALEQWRETHPGVTPGRIESTRPDAAFSRPIIHAFGENRGGAVGLPKDEGIRQEGP